MERQADEKVEPQRVEPERAEKESVPEEVLKGWLRACQSPEPYERMQALKKLLQYAPDKIEPLLNALAKHDPEISIRQYARAMLAQREEQKKAAEEPQHHSRNEVKFQKRLAMLFYVYAVLFVGMGVVMSIASLKTGQVPKDWGLIRFLGEHPTAHVLIGVLCAWAGMEAARESFEGYVVKWVSTLCICVSWPVGPLVGGWMLFNLTGVGAKWRRNREAGG